MAFLGDSLRDMVGSRQSQAQAVVSSDESRSWGPTTENGLSQAVLMGCGEGMSPLPHAGLCRLGIGLETQPCHRQGASRVCSLWSCVLSNWAAACGTRHMFPRAALAHPGWRELPYLIRR